MSVFEVRIEGDARVVVLGELDMATAPQLTSAIESLLGSRPPQVVVDLGGVSFLDSRGVAALCRGQSTLEAAGGELVLGPVSRQVQSVLKMLGLDGRFVVEPDVA
jgi:anti-sigma B factor antagonist